MSDNLTALASENSNPSLRSLLADVQNGHIRVPRFQRPFVWSDKQRLELLQSIRDNMPIGSLLVWRTIKYQLASFESVGPHIISSPTTQAPVTGWQYLLDGHQRVSTLLGLLLQANEPSAGNAEMDGNGIKWDIQYDLMEKEFVFAEKRVKKGASRPLLPLWTLFDGRLVNKQMRELRKQGAQENWSEENLDLWEERADQLSYRFQQCRIPIVVMVTDDLELATRTFQRINSLGTRMGETHLVTALTWTPDFDLRERFNSLRQTLPIGWRDIDEGVFLQVCKGMAGIDVTKAGETEFVLKLKKDPGLLEQVQTGLQNAIQTLIADGGVVHHQFLPYTFQIVFMAMGMAMHGDSMQLRKTLMDWFWRTSWEEAFSSASFRKIREAQESLSKANKGLPLSEWERDDLKFTPFGFATARVKLFILRSALRSDLVDETGQIINGQDLLSKYKKDAFIRLFPEPKNITIDTKRQFQGGGNRFFIDPNSEAAYRDRLLDGPDLSDESLRALFIGQDALQALRDGDIEEFLELRFHAMNEWDYKEWKRVKDQA